MANLILDSLEIQNFRAFRHLKIERLGRVNLITGKNNVGKSSLLEGIWFYVYRGALSVLRKTLQSRNEYYNFSPRERGSEEQVEALNSMFHGRTIVPGHPQRFSVGPLDSIDKTLSLSLVWPTSPIEVTEQKVQRLLPSSGDEGLPLPPSYLSISFDDTTLATHLFSPNMDISVPSERYRRELNRIFITTNGLDWTELSQLWEDVQLTPHEDDVTDALRIISPNIERLGMKSAQGSNTRIPIAKLMDIFSPIPLRSLGEGMNRLFGIALALVNAKDGALLIDEVETGLHYSVLPDVWKLIFRVAHRLNVQVFATTHSWDCIRAFQEAASDNKEVSGELIRLTNKDGNIVDDIFDEEDLEVVTASGIEVR